MRPYSPGGALNALAPAPEGSLPQAPSAHRLRRGLPGYLILFAPHAVAPQRQSWPSRPPSPPVFFRISTHSTATPGIPPASTVLRSRVVATADPGLSPGLSPQPCSAAYAPFTPSDSGQRSHPPYYRGCWHGVSRCFLTRYRQSPLGRPSRPVRPGQQEFTPRGASSSTRRRCVSLAAIAQDSPLLPPVGVWAVSQSQCGWPSSQTSYPSLPWWAITPPTS